MQQFRGLPAQPVRRIIGLLTDESINKEGTHAVDDLGYHLQQFLLEKWELPGSCFTALGAFPCESPQDRFPNALVLECLLTGRVPDSSDSLLPVCHPPGCRVFPYSQYPI